MKARPVELPEAVRALDPLADPDYTFACEIAVPAGDERSAEQWARAVFEGAPTGLRRLLVVGWIVGLGLRLGPRPSPSHVLGWKIHSVHPTMIVLGVGSFALTARVLVQVDDGHNVIHATVVRYQRPIGGALWAVAKPIHELMVPYLLERATNRSGQ